MTGGALIGIAAALVLVAGPSLLGIAGLIRFRRSPGDTAPDRADAWRWKRTAMSALLYTLAFNTTFFIQELFLVLPKAFTPGLRPILFHNNHRWDGDNPLASLFQGTGALATLVTGLACALLVRRSRSDRSTGVQLFLIWMAYCGVFMALPQVVIGAVSPLSDVGMAMGYLQLGVTTRTLAALLALTTIPLFALSLRAPLLELAAVSDGIVGARAQSRWIFRVATLPSMAAILLIIPFRVPREWIEVVMVPAVVTVIGIAWIQAGAWCSIEMKPGRVPVAASIAWPGAAVLALLLIFQLWLRGGIAF